MIHRFTPPDEDQPNATSQEIRSGRNCDYSGIRLELKQHHTAKIITERLLWIHKLSWVFCTPRIDETREGRPTFLYRSNHRWTLEHELHMSLAVVLEHATFSPCSNGLLQESWNMIWKQAARSLDAKEHKT
ncbi:hypothetical protein KCU74_g54, partial [Aureobasidium melanogenum]